MRGVLLIPGFLSDYKDFDAIKNIYMDKYDCFEYVVHPGHEGPNQKSDYYSFDKKETISNVLLTFDRLRKKCQIVDVIGYSMGGALASMVASKRHVNKLVLLAPANKYLNPMVTFESARFFYRGIESYLTDKSDDNAKKIYAEAVRNNIVDSKIGFKFFSEKYFKPYILKAFIEFREIIKVCNANLSKIDCPTLLLYGKLDQLVPKKSIDYLSEQINKDCLTVKIYDNYTHLMLNSKNPDVLVNDIEMFLEV